MRASLQSHTPLGTRVRTFVESGQLVPDDVMLEVVRERLAAKDARDGFVLDGFPRTVSQAQSLAEILGGTPPELDSVIVLDAPTEALVRAAEWAPHLRELPGELPPDQQAAQARRDLQPLRWDR